MTVLVVAPHPDDEAIGCGGAIIGHAARGEDVHVVCLTSGELALGHLPKADAWKVRESEALEAAAVLGVSSTVFVRQPDWFLGDHIAEATERLHDLINDHDPDTIYMPHVNEWHPDHRAAFQATAAAAAQAGLAPCSLLQYELWTPLSFFDAIEDISAHIERKLEAIRCYHSQLSSFDYVQAAAGLARYRGALAAKTAWAEVFHRGCEAAGSPPVVVSTSSADG